MKILFLGDIVGRPGRQAVRQWIPRLTDQKGIDVVIANCENAAGGMGVDPNTAEELFSAGVNILTSGNHVWRKKEIVDYASRVPTFLRPANFPPGTPGKGWVVEETFAGVPIGVINLMGRVFMEAIDCPFRTAEALLPFPEERVKVIVVDMHAEATSEKAAMGWFLDGRVSAVLGSHTHVQTADERVLPGGTAYITDVGMCGPCDSIIGIKKDQVLHRFLTQMPTQFEVASGPTLLQGAIVEIDEETGRAQSICRVQEMMV
jgi:2',3'-cyclic-nucleotide 2'-phosphodiesterase